MSDHPKDRQYCESHEWVQINGDEATVGISDFAQAQLGDLVFVELPECEKQITKGDEVVVLESVKAAADVYAPLSGTVTAVNENLSETPETINQDPHNSGWLYKLKLSDPAQSETLLSAEEYQKQLAE